MSENVFPQARRREVGIVSIVEDLASDDVAENHIMLGLLLLT